MAVNWRFCYLCIIDTGSDYLCVVFDPYSLFLTVDVCDYSIRDCWPRLWTWLTLFDIHSDEVTIIVLGEGIIDNGQPHYWWRIDTMLLQYSAAVTVFDYANDYYWRYCIRIGYCGGNTLSLPYSNSMTTGYWYWYIGDIVFPMVMTVLCWMTNWFWPLFCTLLLTLVCSYSTIDLTCVVIWLF